MDKRQGAMHFEEAPAVSEGNDIHEFLFRNGRYPRLGDAVPPWAFRGWLLPMVQLAEVYVNGENSRWKYYLEIMETGRLPDRPIPKLNFGYPDARKYSDLDKWSMINGYDMGGWRDFEVLRDWFCWGLALSREEPKYHRPDAAERLYREVNLEQMLRHPYDYFGAFISERTGKGWNPRAFYPTPHAVCECMVRMSFHDEGADARHKTVMEPCLGTGRMLLHAAQFSLRLYGMDIDPVVIACALINGALYAPWLSYPLPDSLFAKEDWLAALGREVIDDSPAPEYEGGGRYQPGIFDRAVEVEYISWHATGAGRRTRSGSAPEP